MGQDIREMFERDRKNMGSEKVPIGHQKRFEARMDKVIPRKKDSYTYLLFKIAAVVVVALGIGFFFFLSQNQGFEEKTIVDVPEKEMEKTPSEKGNSVGKVSLADISPEFKKIEDFYLANLNLGLAKIDITEENRALIDSFMTQLAVLDKEYGRLNTEINKNGPDAATVEALINNLQLRLDLLFKLKKKLDELKKEKNENFEKNQA